MMSFDDAGVSGRRAAGAASASGRARRPAARPGGPRGRRAIVAGAAVGLLAAIGVGLAAMLLTSGADGRMTAAIDAFRAGRLEAAEAEFRAVAADRADEVTARLYLARVLRREGRFAEAAAPLREAAARAPSDPDVRRELGWLFLELDRPGAAAEQFERALELDPDQPLGWIGAVRALRAADDPRAEILLRRAPAEVRALLHR